MMRRLVLQKGNTGRHWYEALSTKQQVVSCPTPGNPLFKQQNRSAGKEGKMSFQKKAENLRKALEDVGGDNIVGGEIDIVKVLMLAKAAGSAMLELSKGSQILSGNVYDAFKQAAEIKQTWKHLPPTEASQSPPPLFAESSQSPLPSPAKSSPSSPLPAAQSSFLPTLTELISGMDILLSIRVSSPDKLLIEVEYSDDESVFDLKISDKATGKCVAIFPELSATTFDANEICKEFVEGNRLKLLLVDRKIPPFININHGKQEKELDK